MRTGGLWNTEAILLEQDYGYPLKLQKRQVGDIYADNSTTVSAHVDDNQTVIESGMSTQQNASYLGVNAAGWTTGSSATTAHTILCDAHNAGMLGSNYYWRNFTFTKVEGKNNYTILETIHNSGQRSTISFYLGAVWGTNGNGQNPPNRTHDNNHTAYKDASNTDAVGTIADSLNYQWRFVTRDELLKAVQAQNGDDNGGTYNGLNASVTYLLHDPDFSRDNNAFYVYEDANGASQTSWTVKSNDNVSSTIDNTTNSPLCDWTIQDHAIRRNNNYIDALRAAQYVYLPSGYATSRSAIYQQPWNTPIFRKLQPSDAEWPNSTFEMNNIQYEMATLEGEGEAYQTVTLPTTGRYLLTAHVIAVGDGVTGKLFARPENGTAIEQEVPKVTPDANLWAISDKRTTGNAASWFVNINAGNNWTAVAKQLDQTTSYTVAVMFDVNDVNTNWQLGLSKTGSSKSSQPISDAMAINDISTGIPNQPWLAYADNNYVAIDRMELHYLGQTAPFLFDEEASSVDYMSSSALTNGGFKNRTTYLKRNANINQWQTIVLPISLTTEQVRAAFGNDVQLGKLEGVGKVGAKIPTRIDFSLVPLVPGEVAIQAWNYYLIFATHAPGHVTWQEETTSTGGSTTTETRGGDVYALGRNDYDPANITRTFNNNGTNESQTMSIGDASFSDVIYGSRWSGDSGTTFDGGDQDLQVHGTWTRQVGIAPVHAYYVSNDDMYYLSNPQTVRGFKWWITAGATTQAKGLSFGFFSPGRDVVTFINGVSVDRNDADGDNAVYSLAGVRVADDASSIDSLPSGIYITGGKKIVKR